MIIVQDLETKQKHSFSLIDCHHHIGEDVDGRKNLTYKGSLSFFRNIWKEIQRKYNDDLPDYFSPKFKMLSIEPPNIWKHLESNPLHKNSWVFDKFVAFPFHDKFRIDQSNPASDQITYRTSNVRLSKFMVDDKIYGRYIGWCRLDLHDGEKIIQELVDLVSKYGMKGLKLHPLSDDWNEPEFFQDPEGILIKTLLTA